MKPDLSEWLIANRPLILFIYGLTFFVVGLAIALQLRRSSRLKLARSLPWLAGFGFLHGFNEWGDLFLPIQQPFLAPPFYDLLRAVQLILLATSFASLFQFGIELMRPLPDRWRWIRFVPSLALLIWFLGPFWLGLVFIQDTSTWQNIANALARYLLCVPGSFLSGYALFKQGREQIRPLQLKNIERMLVLSASALLAYGILGGMIVPQSPFFPANFINTTTFEAIFILPPPVFRSVAGLLLAITIIRALEVFEVETQRLVLQMEENLVISNERERIGRDLHDGALQQIYAAGLLAQSLRKQADGALAENLDRLIILINHGIEQLRRFLSQGQIEVHTVELIPALESILDDTRRFIQVETRWETVTSPSLTPEQINHLTAFTREALSNAIRHAQTDRVEVRLECREDHLTLMIRDFGQGLPQYPEMGYGLRNMRDRARLLGGELAIESIPQHGTTVILTMPVRGKG
ncbi:MAG: sensor histidine kinase [Anaerolineales bacterium]